MNLKQLHREYRLSKLTGSNLDPEVKDILSLLKDNLKGLNCYTTDKYPNWNFYGKDKGDIVLKYNRKNGYLFVHNGKIWSFFSDKMSYKYSDIQDIISWYVGVTLKLQCDNTYNDLIIGVQDGLE